MKTQSDHHHRCFCFLHYKLLLLLLFPQQQGLELVQYIPIQYNTSLTSHKQNKTLKKGPFPPSPFPNALPASMAHHPSQRRNMATPEPEPEPEPNPTNPDLIQTYKPSFLVKQLSSLNLSQTHKTHKRSPLIDTYLQAKPMTTSAKRTHKEKPQRPCLELERRKLGDPNDKGMVENAATKVEKGKPRNPHLEKQDVADRMSVSVSLSGGRRRSFCGSQADLRDVFAINGAKMVSVDMPPFMQIHAVDSARKAIDSMEKFTSKTLALSLKKEFDGVYGPAWHCIVGTSFGSFVTHSVGGFLYFSMDQKLHILLFKTAVQKAAP